MPARYELKITENGKNIIAQIQDFRHDNSKLKMKNTVIRSINDNLISNLNDIGDIKRIDVAINIYHANGEEKGVKKRIKRIVI